MPQDYYYANRDRVPLEPDAEHVAVDLTADVAGRAQEITHRTLPGNLGLFRRADLPGEVRAEIERSADAYPVYRSHGATLVVLPEVRVEIGAEQKEELLTSIQTGPLRGVVVRDDGDRLVLRPESGNGADALKLANRLHESLHPKSAQARFVRIVPRSKV